MALRSDGTVAAWGDNSYGQCDVPADLTGVIQISAGYEHALALIAAAHLVLDQKVVNAGDSATGTVKLASAAGAGGAVVNLICDDAGVHIPTSVTVPEGAKTVTFPVMTDFGFVDHVATIRTSYGATATVPFKLTVKGDSAALAFNHPTVYGGSTTKVLATLSVSFTSPTDLDFDVKSSDPSATVPDTVTLRAGHASVSFYVGHSIVAKLKAIEIEMFQHGTSVAHRTLTVNPISGTLTLSPADLKGGESSQGTITLNAPVAADLKIPLSSSRPVASVPASVTVVAGSKTATFPILTAYVPKAISDVISATVNGNPANAVMHLTPGANLQSVSLPTYLYGHGRVTGTVTLTSPAPAGGETITLASSDPALTVPASVTVPEGATSSTFTAEGDDVAAITGATVTASVSGGSVHASTEVRPLTVSSLTLSAGSVSGGTSVTGTVNLNVAVAVDTVVYLTSDNAAVASVPTTATIPAGSRTVTFTITTTSPATAKNAKITAAKNSTSAYRTLKVTP